jgi:hypothetical protein
MMLLSPRLVQKFLAPCLGRMFFYFFSMKIFLVIIEFSVEEIEEVMAAGRQEEPLKLPQDSVAAKHRNN